MYKEYTSWLASKVGCDTKGYQRVIKALWSTPYYFDTTVPFEDNTVNNALDLRGEYFAIEPCTEDFESCPVSMLEVMVCLAVDYYRFIGEESEHYYFENMIIDSGIWNGREVDANAINTVNFRLYDKYGRGGMFPLMYVPPALKDWDSTKTCLWRQINAYYCQ